MLLCTALKNGGIRATAGARGVTAYADKAQGDDLLLMSTPEEQPVADHMSWPGEYDKAGITLRGISHDEGQKVSWLAVVDGIRIAFPVTPSREWTDHEIEQLGDIHVLVAIADDAKKVQKLLDDIDPRVLILLPADKGFDGEVVKACGAVGKEVVSEFKLKGLPAEGREVVMLAA